MFNGNALLIEKDGLYRKDTNQAEASLQDIATRKR